MDYRNTSGGYVLQLHRGDQIIASLTEFAVEEDIEAGFFTGIGAFKDLTIGYFDTEKQGYPKRSFQGTYEVLSCQGNFSIKDGEPFPHCHILFSDTDSRTYGGHLFEATVAVTGEFQVQVLPNPITRTLDPDIGLELWDL